VVSIPRLVIAAPASGAGKTTVATGLMAALTARGLRVAPGKVGPDYIDPGYHALATGRPGRNLDPFLVGAERIAPLFVAGAAGADIAVVEGVMGLYDGRGASTEASSAHVAGLLAAPVLLVVDAASMSRSVAALVHGFATYDAGVRIGGVILNRVGSDRHEALLRAALADSGVPVLGVLRRDAAVATPSRHLGLVPVAERSADAVATVSRLGELIAAGCDLDAIVALARSAPPLTAPAWSAAEAVGMPVPGRPRIAVAGGAAFTFSYAETTELLRAVGAEVVPVDPLRDEALPAGTTGIVIGGGFPEVYAGELAANTALHAQVRALADGGGPIIAECAGLLYLARSLDGQPMCGVLPTDARMTDRLTLGYREAVGATGALRGVEVRAHEFHRTVATPAASGRPAWLVRGDAGDRPEGFLVGGVLASYLHLHWAGVPVMARAVVGRAAACAVAV
jgi:cobyrinic acid a,c-diamide synthase